MTSLYLIEPENPGSAWVPFAQAGPLSDLRAGAWRIHERWAMALGATTAGIVATHARGPRLPGAVPVVDAGTLVGPAWVVDALFCPRLPTREVGGARRLLHAGRTVAWRLDSGERWTGPHNTGDGMVIEGRALQGSADLVTALEELLFDDTLSALDGSGDPVPDGTIVLGNSEAISLRGAELEPGVVLDVRKGAIILESGVVVRSGSRIEGPSWIRTGTHINGGQLRQISAGQHCRLHGELATTVLMGYANKGHDGFVGHSVIGEWANLGAGTTTSNLKNTYGPVRLDLPDGRIDTGRTFLGALIGEAAQDVALGAVVDGDDVELRVLEPAEALVPLPARLVPMVGLGGGDFARQIEALEPGEGLEFSQHRRLVEPAVGGVADNAVGHAGLADAGRQGTGVDAGDADDVAGLQPSVEPVGGTVVRGVGDVGAQHAAADPRKGGHVHRLDVLVVGADIADMRKGEGDNLPRIGGVGENLLIPRHRCVEADFAHRRAWCADAEALQYGAVGEHEQRRRSGLRPAGIVLFAGHEALR